MTMQNLLEGFKIIEANPNRGFFAGSRDSGLIAAAENALGCRFPPTYREFLSRLGAGNLGAFEFYGITTGNFESGKVPNGIWLTLKHHRAGRVPSNLLVIGDTGDGSYYCIELRTAGLRPDETTRFSISETPADDVFVVNDAVIPFATGLDAAEEFFSTSLSFSQRSIGEPATNQQGPNQ